MFCYIKVRYTMLCYIKVRYTMLCYIKVRFTNFIMASKVHIKKSFWHLSLNDIFSGAATFSNAMMYSPVPSELSGLRRH